MSTLRVLRLPLLLSLAAILGIIGMLVFDDSLGDTASFALAALPLIVGVVVLLWRKRARQ